MRSMGASGVIGAGSTLGRKKDLVLKYWLNNHLVLRATHQPALIADEPTMGVHRQSSVKLP